MERNEACAPKSSLLPDELPLVLTPKEEAFNVSQFNYDSSRSVAISQGDMPHQKLSKIAAKSLEPCTKQVFEKQLRRSNML